MKRRVLGRAVGVSVLVLGASLGGVACGSSDDVAAAAGAGGSGGSGGAAGDAGGDAPAPTFCSGATALMYDPLAGNVDAFPDDFFTVDDETTKSGVKVSFVDGQNFHVPPNGAMFKSVFDDLSTLDGFGTTAELVLQVTAPLDESTLPTRASAKATDSVVLFTLDGAAEFVPLELSTFPESPTDSHTTLFISPMVPLKPKTRYAVAVTNGVKDAGGGCIAPSAVMQALLGATATEAGLTRLAPRYAEAISRLKAAGTISDAGQLSALVTFTTQHTVEDSATIAQKIRAKGAPAYVSAGACTTPSGSTDYVICEGSYSADDYRKNRRNVDDQDLNPQASYTLKVTTYLPTAGTAPYPTLIFGHGLSGDRHQAERLAAIAAPQGFATVAIDSVKHGEHPDGGGVLAFFGISISNLANPLDALALRDNWRQATYDKLQLVELLRPGVDVNGDSTKDVDLSHLIYLGVSLGGIMSAEFLAFVPEAGIAVPIVPGARVVDIIRDSKTFAPVLGIMQNLSKASPGMTGRFFPVVQTAIDRGDSGAYVGHIVRDRLPGFDSVRPQLLMQMVIADDTVPNPSNSFFARGLGVPHVGDELLAFGVIPHVQALPVSGNVDATHSAGVFQFDLEYVDQGPATEPATHGGIAANPVATEQSFHFIQTALQTGLGEILDPYRTLHVKP